MSEDDAASERRFTNRLAVYWEGLRRERHGLIPLESDVDIDAIEDIWDHCFMVEVGEQGDTLKELDYKYAYMGASIADAYGGDLTGKQVYNELIALHTEKLLLKFLTVVKTGRPLSDESQFCNLQGVLVRYRQRFVPLGGSGDSIGFVMGVMTWRSFEEGEPVPAKPQPEPGQQSVSPSLRAMEKLAESQAGAAPVHPEIRDYVCSEIDNVYTWRPTSPEEVCFDLGIKIGATCSENSHLFRVKVLTPEFIRVPENRPVLENGDKYVVVASYSWEQVEGLLNQMLSQCVANSWDGVLDKLTEHFDLQD